MTSIVASIASSTASIRVARAPASARGVARGCARVNARHASKRPIVRMRAIEAETVSVESEKVTAFYADQMVDEAGMLAQSTFPIAPEDLIAKCKLILAKNNGADVFNCLDLMENNTVFEKLKFGPGDGMLQYYLYNWRAPHIECPKVGLVLL